MKLARLFCLSAGIIIYVAGMFAGSTQIRAAAGDPSPEVLIEQQHYKQARKMLEQRLTQNPKDPKTIELMAKIKLQAQQNDDVIKMIEPVLAQNPNNAEFHIILADANGQKAGGAGAGMFEKMHCGRTMKKEGDTALSLDPKNIDALQGMIQFHMQAPGMVGGDKKKAHEYADRLVAVDPVKGNFMQAQIAAEEKHDDQIEGF